MPTNIEGNFLRILYKINEIYSKHFYGKEDLLEDINYYESKKKFSEEEIIKLEEKCEKEWQKVLKLLYKSLIDKIESKNKFQERLKIELKQSKSIYKKLENASLKLDEYENIYSNEWESLKDNIDVKLYKEKIENRRFWYGFAVGLGIGIIGILISLIY